MIDPGRWRGAAQDFFDLARNRIDLGHAIDGPQNAALTIIRQDGRGLAMIDIEPRPDRLRPVVGAADEFAAAASIANSVDLRPVVALMVAGTTLLTGKPSREPVNQGVLVDVELDHVVEPAIVLCQHLIKRLRLRQRSGETVENKAVTAIWLPDAVGDHVDDDIVGDELAGIHDALDAQPELAPRKGRGPQHVSGGELSNPVVLLYPLRLSPLPRAWRPEQDDVHPRRPRSFAFLIRPSY